MTRRLAAALPLVAVIVMAMGSAVAQAHANFIRSDPPPNARLATAPAQIVVGFSQSVQASESSLALLSGDGRTVKRGAQATSDATEVMLMLPVIGEGTYAVAWQALAADGDRSNGYFAFGVGAEKPESGPGTTFRAMQSGVTLALMISPFRAGENTYMAMLDGGGPAVTRVRLRIRPLDQDIGLAQHDLDPTSGLSGSGMELVFNGRYHIVAQVRRQDVSEDLVYEFDGTVPTAGAQPSPSPASASPSETPSGMAMAEASPTTTVTRASAAPASSRSAARLDSGLTLVASLLALLAILFAGVLLAPQARIRAARARLGAFLDERLGLAGVRYSVPEHANSLPYVLGGITLAGFVVLLVTGVYLAQFYHPQPTDAHESVVYIITGAPLGDVIRSVHYWSAQIVVVTLILHLLRVLLTGSFKRPRELNWFIGLGLFAAIFGFVYTGTVLKFDQEAVEALAHNTAWAELVGGIGLWFSADFSQSVPLLTRVYVGHTSILPLLFFALLATHVFLIKQHGISPQVTSDAVARATAGEGTSHFDAHLRRMAGYGLLLVAAALALSLVIPAPLGFPGVAGAEVTRPPWMFVWLVPYEGRWGIDALVIAPLILGAALALVPFLDRSPFLDPRRRLPLLTAATLVLVVIIASSVYAELQPIASHLMDAGATK